eukprot:scaffold52434_cov81-Phaeocystis_antarctica.AAC.1
MHSSTNTDERCKLCQDGARHDALVRVVNDEGAHAARGRRHDRRAAQHAPELPDVQPHRAVSATRARRAGGAAALEVPAAQRSAYVVRAADDAQRGILRPRRATPGRRDAGRSAGRIRAHVPDRHAHDGTHRFLRPGHRAARHR